MELRESFFHRFWFLIVALLIAANLIAFSFQLAKTAADGSGQTDSIVNISMKSKGISTSVATIENSFGKAANTTGKTLDRAARGVGSVATTSLWYTGHAAQTGATFIGRSTVDGVVAAASTPGHLANSALSAVTDSAVTELAKQNKAAVPVISPAPILVAQTAQTASSVSPQVSATAPQWPLRGAITTPFGVPEPPYEAVHTGLDISDGNWAGTTPIHPFKTGQVAEVIHSAVGLGNHVVIDHGGGITSVYGHLASVSVQVGQQVGEDTVLGYEGSTGASTGAHLHFETRVNGQPVDPHRFIGGQP